MENRKVLLLEINEVTWDLIDPLIAESKLPVFAHLKHEGAWGVSAAIEVPPQLDPWITWTTLYTGQPQSEHNVYFLQQPAGTITAKRLWEHCKEAGLSVGVYGSVCSYPPQPVDGYYIPDTFAPDAKTYPPELSAIQTLNLTYTRSVRLPSDQDSLSFKMKLGVRLLSLGLGAREISAIVQQLASERFNSRVRWKRVSLQPLVNFAFFRKLYLRHRPDFATFHTNHVAHYMHTYWKAMQPDKFLPLETSKEEIETYGGAIEHGYRTADRLLGRVLELLDEQTVLIVASSMGQKPFTTKLKGGKQIAQWRSLDALLDLIGAKKTAKAVATMSDEFVIYASDPAECARIKRVLDSSYIDDPKQITFVTGSIEGAVRVNLKPYDVGTIKPASKVHFPDAGGSPVRNYEDVIYNTGHLKSGSHDPRGIIMFYGAGMPAGVRITDSTNLNIAPTIMRLLGQQVPATMKALPIGEIVSQLPTAAAGAR